jgi:hypothetical protein
MKIGKYVSPYLKASDVKTSQKVTISATEAETFKDQETGKERDAIVLFFKELEQGVVASRTTLESLAELLGSDETDEWIGKSVVLYNDLNVTFKGKRTGGIRFRAVE